MKKALGVLSVAMAAGICLAGGLDVATSGAVAGEWTADLSAARKLAKKNGRFYLIIYGDNTGGCQLCNNAADSIFTKKYFKNWAKNNNIPLVYASTGTDTAAEVRSIYFNRSDWPRVLLIDGDGNGKQLLNGEFYAAPTGGEKLGYLYNSPYPENFVRILENYIMRADDSPYASQSAKLPRSGNTTAWEVGATTTEQSFGIYKDYGVRDLYKVYGNRNAIAENKSDWFVVTNKVTAGMGIRLGATDVDDALNYGRVSIYGTRSDAQNKENALYEATLSEFAAKGYVHKTPSGQTYVRFWRGSATENDVTCAYKFTYQLVPASDKFTFDVVTDEVDVTEGETLSLVVRRTNTDTAADVSVLLSEIDAEAGVDYDDTATTVHFDVGAETAQWEVAIPRGEVGVWSGSRQFTARLLQDEAPEGIFSLEVTVNDADPELDAADPADDVRNGATAFVGDTVSARLNGSDTVDYYVFTGLSAKKLYKVEPTVAFMTNAVALTVALETAGGEELASATAPEALYYQPAADDETVYLKVERETTRASGAVCVLYEVAVSSVDAGNADGATADDAHQVDLPATSGAWASAGARNLTGAAAATDWIVFAPTAAGTCYRLAADGVKIEPADVDVQVTILTNGVAALGASLADLATNAPCFTLDADVGALTCTVVRATAAPAVVEYALKLREWTKPVISFASAAGKTDDTNATYTVALTRAANTSERDVAYVVCGDTRVEAVFEPGEDAAGAEVGFDDAAGLAGLWRGDVSVVYGLELADATVCELGDPSAFTLTRLETDLEYEAGDSADESADAPVVSATVGKEGILSSRTLNGADVEDFFAFQNCISGMTYRFQVSGLDATNATNLKAEIALPGVEKTTVDLASLATRAAFVAAADGDAAVRVFRDDTSTPANPVSVRYALFVDMWQQPAFTFAVDSVTVDDTNATFRIAVERKYNFEADHTVEVRSADGTAKAGTDYTTVSASVTFPAGEENTNAWVEVKVKADTQNLWTGDRSFTLVLDVGDEYQAGEIVELTATLHDLDAMLDAKDPADDASASATSHAISGTPAKSDLQRLNGEDLVDWHVFTGVRAGKYYKFGVADLTLNNVAAGDIAARVYANGDLDTPVATFTFAEMAASSLRLPAKTENNNDIYVEVVRASSASAVSVAYALVFREQAARQVQFTTDSIRVSEAANAVYAEVAFSADGVEDEEDPPTITATVTAMVDDKGAYPAEPDIDFDPVAVTLTWKATTSGATLRAPIPLTNFDSNWEGDETFKLVLTADDDTDVGDISEMTVTIADKDTPTYGTVAITAHDALTVREGGEFGVEIARTAGDAGAVTGKWTWTVGKTKKGTTTMELFADREAGTKAFAVPVPTTAGFQLSQAATLEFALIAPAKTVTVKKGSPTSFKLTITDADFGGKVAAYSAGDASKIGFRTTGTAWYLAADGALASSTPSAGSSTVLSCDLTGPGTLTLDVALTDAKDCTLTAKVGGKSTTLVEGVNELSIGSGSQRVLVTFARGKKAADTAAARIVSATFTRDEEAYRYGTFSGPASVDGLPGLGTLTVGFDGKYSGKIACPGHTWTFSGKGGWTDGGEITNVVAACGRERLQLLLGFDAATTTVRIQPDCGCEASVDAELRRSPWKDKPMSAAAAVLAGYAGYYTISLPQSVHGGAAEFGSGYLTATVGASGAVKVSGVLADGTSASASGTLALGADGQPAAFVLAKPSAYKGGWFFSDLRFQRLEVEASGDEEDDDGGDDEEDDEEPAEDDSAVPVVTAGDPSALAAICGWTSLASTGFERDVQVSGGWYDKTANLYDYYLYEKGASLAFEPIAEVGAYYAKGELCEASTWGAKSAVGVSFSTNGKRMTLDADAADGLLTGSFVPATGIFSGSIRIRYEGYAAARQTAYKGVLTPFTADGEAAGRGFFNLVVYEEVPEDEEDEESETIIQKVKRSFDVRIVEEE